MKLENLPNIKKVDIHNGYLTIELIDGYLIRLNFNDVESLKKQLRIGGVSERFSSEGETLQWFYLNTPFAIKPISKKAKTLLVNPFTSTHAFEEVCKHLADKLYNAR